MTSGAVVNHGGPMDTTSVNYTNDSQSHVYEKTLPNCVGREKCMILSNNPSSKHSGAISTMLTQPSEEQRTTTEQIDSTEITETNAAGSAIQASTTNAARSLKNSFCDAFSAFLTTKKRRQSVVSDSNDVGSSLPKRAKVEFGRSQAKPDSFDQSACAEQYWQNQDFDSDEYDDEDDDEEDDDDDDNDDEAANGSLQWEEAVRRLVGKNEGDKVISNVLGAAVNGYSTKDNIAIGASSVDDDCIILDDDDDEEDDDNDDEDDNDGVMHDIGGTFSPRFYDKFAQQNFPIAALTNNYKQRPRSTAVFGPQRPRNLSVRGSDAGNIRARVPVAGNSLIRLSAAENLRSVRPVTHGNIGVRCGMPGPRNKNSGNMPVPITVFSQNASVGRIRSNSRPPANFQGACTLSGRNANVLHTANGLAVRAGCTMARAARHFNRPNVIRANASCFYDNKANLIRTTNASSSTVRLNTASAFASRCNMANRTNGPMCNGPNMKLPITSVRPGTLAMRNACVTTAVPVAGCAVSSPCITNAGNHCPLSTAGNVMRSCLGGVRQASSAICSGTSTVFSGSVALTSSAANARCVVAAARGLSTKNVSATKNVAFTNGGTIISATPQCVQNVIYVNANSKCAAATTHGTALAVSIVNSTCRPTGITQFTSQRGTGAKIPRPYVVVGNSRFQVGAARTGAIGDRKLCTNTSVTCGNARFVVPLVAVGNAKSRVTNGRRTSLAAVTGIKVNSKMNLAQPAVGTQVSAVIKSNIAVTSSSTSSCQLGTISSAAVPVVTKVACSIAAGTRYRVSTIPLPDQVVARRSSLRSRTSGVSSSQNSSFPSGKSSICTTRHSAKVVGLLSVSRPLSVSLEQLSQNRIENLQKLIKANSGNLNTPDIANFMSLRPSCDQCNALQKLNKSALESKPVDNIVLSSSKSNNTAATVCIATDAECSEDVEGLTENTTAPARSKSHRRQSKPGPPRAGTRKSGRGKSNILEVPELETTVNPVVESAALVPEKIAETIPEKKVVADIFDDGFVALVPGTAESKIAKNERRSSLRERLCHVSELLYRRKNYEYIPNYVTHGSIDSDEDSDDKKIVPEILPEWWINENGECTDILEILDQYERRKAAEAAALLVRKKPGRKKKILLENPNSSLTDSSDLDNSDVECSDVKSSTVSPSGLSLYAIELAVQEALWCPIFRAKHHITSSSIKPGLGSNTTKATLGRWGVVHKQNDSGKIISRYLVKDMRTGKFIKTTIDRCNAILVRVVRSSSSAISILNINSDKNISNSAADSAVADCAVSQDTIGDTSAVVAEVTESQGERTSKCAYEVDIDSNVQCAPEVDFDLGTRCAPKSGMNPTVLRAGKVNKDSNAWYAENFNTDPNVAINDVQHISESSDVVVATNVSNVAMDRVNTTSLNKTPTVQKCVNPTPNIGGRKKTQRKTSVDVVNNISDTVTDDSNAAILSKASTTPETICVATTPLVVEKKKTQRKTPVKRVSKKTKQLVATSNGEDTSNMGSAKVEIPEATNCNNDSELSSISGKPVILDNLQVSNYCRTEFTENSIETKNSNFVETNEHSAVMDTNSFPEASYSAGTAIDCASFGSTGFQYYGSSVSQSQSEVDVCGVQAFDLRINFNSPATLPVYYPPSAYDNGNVYNHRVFVPSENFSTTDFSASGNNATMSQYHMAVNNSDIVQYRLQTGGPNFSSSQHVCNQCGAVPNYCICRQTLQANNSPAVGYGPCSGTTDLSVDTIANIVQNINYDDLVQQGGFPPDCGTLAYNNEEDEDLGSWLAASMGI